MNFGPVHNRLKIGPEFLHALYKFCILFHCQASQTLLELMIYSSIIITVISI